MGLSVLSTVLVALAALTWSEASDTSLANMHAKWVDAYSSCTHVYIVKYWPCMYMYMIWLMDKTTNCREGNCKYIAEWCADGYEVTFKVKAATKI